MTAESRSAFDFPFRSPFYRYYETSTLPIRSRCRTGQGDDYSPNAIIEDIYV